MKRHFHYLSLGSVLAWSMLACSAQAQDMTASPAPAASAPQNDGIADIVVTAQKRSQSLNRVGLSITAADTSQLASAGVRDTGDLAKIAPGLTFTKSQDGTPLFTIRGVGFNDYTLGASPAVSVYVDQIPLAYGAYTQGATLDLERVEILKGPQGILFGQNSTGGAINYIAAKPTDTFKAGVKASYGRFNTFDGEAYVSGPITDILGFRIAGSTTQSGDWQNSYTRKDSLGRQDILRGRLQLELKPSDNFSMLLSVNGWRDKSDTQAAQLVGLKLQQDASAPGLYDPAATLPRIAAFEAYPFAPGNARAADWDTNRKMARDDGMYQISLRIDGKISDSITLTSLSAFTKYNQNYNVDRDGTTLVNAGVISHGSVKSFSQELRLSGDTGPVTWMIGGNYASNDVKSADTFLVGDSTNTAIFPGLPFNEATTRITQDIRDIAGFGNVEFKVTDQLTLLAGGRYTDSRNNYTGCMVGDYGHRTTFWQISQLLSGVAQDLPTADTCVNSDPTTFVLIRTPHKSKLKENNFSWRLGVNYQATPDVLLYALASRGYKSGSFPTVPATTTAQLSPVKQESVTAYEAGVKATLLDRKLQVNLAAFHYQYNDKQIRGLIIDPIFNQLERLVNIPRSRINGAEIEITTRPVSGLTLRLAGTYVDSKVLEFNGINNDRVLGNYRGSALPFSPKWQAVSDIEYRWRVGNDVEAFVGGNILYNGKTNSTLGNPESSRIRDFATLDLRAGLASTDGRWNASIWGRNITNSYYWSNQFVTQDVIVRYAAKPVTYGVSVGYNF